MENLLELLRKYNMTNEDVLSTSGSPLATTNLSNNEMNMGVSQGMGLEDQSLLGSDRKTNKTLSLMGLLGSPEALTGLSLLSAGMKGQSISEAALPSFVEGLKVSSTVRTMTKEQEQQKAIDEFADKVPEQYKPLFKAFPKETMKLLLTPKEPSLTALEVNALKKLDAGLPLNPSDKILIDKLKSSNIFSQIGDLAALTGNKELAKFAASQEKPKETTTTTTTQAPKGKITLTSMPDKNSLVKNQTYTIKGKDYVWDGSNFITQ